jgi:hypothetical protein
MPDGSVATLEKRRRRSPRSRMTAGTA